MISITLRGSSLSKAPGASSSGDLGITAEPRSPSPILQAIAAGLQRDAASEAAGWNDGKFGAPFQPSHFDPFAYACGFGAGRQLCASRVHNGGGLCVVK